MSQVSLGRPEFVPVTPPGHPTAKFLYVIFLYRFFSLHKKGTPKNFCDKDLAELSGELSVAICLKTLVLLGSALELFRKFFGTVRAIFWVWGSVFFQGRKTT